MFRRLRSDESGWSLTEVMVTTALLGVVCAALMSFLMASQSNFERHASRSISNDEVRLAVESLDREIRSGNVVYNPALENFAAGDIASGMSVRVYSRTNDSPRCVQWRITSDRELQRRQWTPSWYAGKPGATVGSWRTVATDITNRLEGIAAFTRPQTNIVNIRMRANDDLDGSKGSTVEVDQSVSGRNTSHFPNGDASEVCGPATPDPATAPTQASGGWIPPYGS